ncbi:MAG: hypothetical protein L3J98_16715 [Gammaproteobacteria bacterium]|nr:hypothetical protein [Gammaproteobacteria bacterium]MCF6261773.1 hypothetical protein [Gammaproteobacteria bacterium]
MYKIKKLILPVVIIFFAVVCTTINANPKAQNNNNATSLISIVDSPGFKSFKLTLSHIVKERNPDANGPQHFYVAKYTKGKAFTYMFWPEMKLLWVMSLGGLDEESWLGVRYPSSGQLIDLQNSVVSTTDKVGSSSYLVTKDWAANRLFDAVIKGDLIVINEKGL